MTTLKELQEETDKYRDTLVIDFSEIKLFRKIVDEPEDFYYEYVAWRETKSSLSSCVGWFIPLIDRLDKEQYNYLVNVWNLNNEIQIEKI